MKYLSPPSTYTRCSHTPQVADMRISYERGGLEESAMAPYAHDPMRAWAAWFNEAVEHKVGACTARCFVIL